MQTTQNEIIIIKCKECGCTREIGPTEVPKGDCHYCKKDFGYYLWPLGQCPRVLLKHLPLHHGDIVVIDTASPAIINDNHPNFDRIYSIEREGVIIYQQ